MARPHVEIIEAADVAPGPVPAAGWPAGATTSVLSRDDATGAFSGLLQLPPDWRREACHHPATAVDLYVVAGTVHVGGRVCTAGWFGFWPAGTSQPAWVAGADGAELFLGARAATPDAIPGPGPCGSKGVALLDTERLDWELAPEGPPEEQISGLPEGIVTKTLRWVEETGELLALCATVPRWAYPRLEFHECCEEAFMLRGDIWLGSSGTMRAGSYFWRPPYITHGPFWSQAGCLFLVYTDTLLVDLVADGPLSTPDDNRRIAAGRTAA